MRTVIAAVTLLALAAPLPAFAQDSDIEATTADIEAKLGDPAVQGAMAEGMAAASEALLDLPLAPMMKAIAKAAGEDPEAVDPDMTLRRASPEAEGVPDQVRERLPAMMGAMAGMAGGMGAMVPALKDMAARMAAAMAKAGAEARDAY